MLLEAILDNKSDSESAVQDNDTGSRSSSHIRVIIILN